MIRNLAWLREQTSVILNFNVSQTDQDFIGTPTDIWQEVDRAINEAYNAEYIELFLNTSTEWFQRTHSFNWAVNIRTLTLPIILQDVEILRIDDITSTVPGHILYITKRGPTYEPMVSFLDNKTLQWGTSGPNETKTLQATYIPTAAELTNPADEPDLIPTQFRYLIPWSAAILLRRMADNAAPQDWSAQLFEWREKAIIYMSKGRPRSTNRTQIYQEETND